MRWMLLLLPWTAALAQDGPTLTIESETNPPTIVNHFEQDAAPWVPMELEDEPAAVDFRLVPAAGRGQVLQIKNAVTGGYVASQILKGSRRTPVYSHLRFDYAADPSLKVNLRARVDYQELEFGLTGVPAEDGRSQWMGNPCETAADGAWHTYELPLLRYVRRVKPTSRAPKPQLLALQNQHAGDYLLAGFGGNPLGAAIQIDNFALYRPGRPTAEFDLITPRSSKADGYAIVLDREPTTDPGQTVTTTETKFSVQDLAEGTWYLHGRAHSDAGWGPVTHCRFEVDAKPPAAREASPSDGATGCPDAWTCTLTDDGVGVAPASVLVAVSTGRPQFRDEAQGEAATAISEYTIQSDALDYDPVSGRLALQLGRLERKLDDGSIEPIRLADGASVGIAVRASDENGLAMPPLRTSFRLRQADDHDPPTAPELLLHLPGSDPQPLPGDGTFEYGLDEWSTYVPTGVVVERTDKTAAAGRYSLRLLCTENANEFTVIARRTAFDAGRFRVLSFDYRVPPRLRVDWYVRLDDGTSCFIRFTDRDADEATISSDVPQVDADDTWHHMELPLYELLRSRFPERTSYRVALLLLTGGMSTQNSRRWPGTYAGTEYFLDNFHLVPMLGADTRLEWRGVDTVGVAGAEVVSAEREDELPAPDAAGGERVAGSGIDLSAVRQGLVYLRARLYDAAGNLSQPVLTRFLVDAGKPVTGGVWPADGSRVAPSDLGLELRDDRGAGLDLASVVLSVAGVDYKVDGRVLRYDPNAGRLTWDGRVARQPIRFDNGQHVEVELVEARDHAGNRPDQLPTWSFTVDYAEDHTGPMVRVSSRSHPSHMQEGFDTDSTLSFHATGAASSAVGPDQRGAGRALWITPSGGGAFATTFALETPCMTMRYRYLRLDYRLPPSAKVDLELEVLDAAGEPHAGRLRLTGDTADGAPIVAEVEGIVADGAWHTALIDADALLKAARFEAPRKVTTLTIVGHGAAGEAIGIDNLALLRVAPLHTLRTTWEALDVSGVQGFSYVLDRNPDTVPEERVMSTEPAAEFEDAPAGDNWLHVRALDGAGNWGPTTHYVMMVRGDAGEQ